MGVFIFLVIVVAIFGGVWYVVHTDFRPSGMAEEGKDISVSRYLPASPIVAPAPVRWPYVKKTFLMNRTEYVFFKALRQAIGDSYVIFAQVHLTKLVEIPKGTRNWQGLWNRIDKKSVDFALCEVAGVRPVLAIELDGSGHSLKDRTARDQFVKEVFEQAGLKFLRFEAQQSYDIENLRNEILNKIRSA